MASDGTRCLYSIIFCNTHKVTLKNLDRPFQNQSKKNLKIFHIYENVENQEILKTNIF